VAGTVVVLPEVGGSVTGSVVGCSETVVVGSVCVGRVDTVVGLVVVGFGFS
jgi:hypothetical protein